MWFLARRTTGTKRENSTMRSKLYTYTGVSSLSSSTLEVEYGTLVSVVPGSGSLRWAFEGGTGMSDEESTHRPNLSRRRRANTPAGTKKRRDVWVTVEEEAALVARAEREKVTVPNLLVSSALAERTDSPTERRAIGAELMQLHNLLARSSNNINQLARQANATGEFPVEAREALKHLRTVAMRIDRAIEGLM
ncbi:conserved hypothetical protein (plasmid) [Paenarthrobacter aurescens TC1]|uniref:Bacterial mobilisation domain-containing protein n=2 Tax=Paenarthrobacter aurescens TaxID=43663 RepID=A1RDC9_PAEAT|nr:conserved hypothetical protein [Paenarthrobacter aurescens TC1]